MCGGVFFSLAIADCRPRYLEGKRLPRRLTPKSQMEMIPSPSRLCTCPEEPARRSRTDRRGCTRLDRLHVGAAVLLMCGRLTDTGGAYEYGCMDAPYVRVRQARQAGLVPPHLRACVCPLSLSRQNGRVSMFIRLYARPVVEGGAWGLMGRAYEVCQASSWGLAGNDVFSTARVERRQSVPLGWNGRRGPESHHCCWRGWLLLSSSCPCPLERGARHDQLVCRALRAPWAECRAGS